MEGKHAKLEVRNGVGVVTINSPGSKVNVLNNEIMEDMLKIMDRVESDGEIEAAVLVSSKAGCFIAGADISLIEKCQNEEEAREKSGEMQKILKAIEDSMKPVIAVIHGSCLGGGLEVALACHYRVGIRDRKTLMGLPEVLIGLLPGGGGTQRLPQLVGIPSALDMILTGRSVSVDQAMDMKLIDEVWDLEELGGDLEKAVKIAQDLASGRLEVRRTWGMYETILSIAISYIGYVRNKVFGKARAQVMKQSKGLYPAPLKILQVVQTGVEKGEKAGYEAESAAFGELAMTSQCRGLISLFHGQTECKKNRFADALKTSIRNVGVVGAGELGVGIVQVTTDKGFTITVRDVEETLDKAKERIHKGLDGLIQRKRITEYQLEDILSSITFQPSLVNFEKLDIVITAVEEDLEEFQRVFRELDIQTADECILAAATSALPITKIASATSRPNKVVGMHYFIPVTKMQLLEVVKTNETSKETLAAAVQVGLKQGKVVIVVQDSPGFYVTRLLYALVMEMMFLLEEGVDPIKLDDITTSFGFPIGLCSMCDELGLDSILTIVKVLSEDLKGLQRDATSDLLLPTEAALKILDSLVASGSLGRKSGKGLFVYEDKTQTRRVNPEAEQIINSAQLVQKICPENSVILLRLVTRVVNEAAQCLEEGVIQNQVEGDVGAVFGLGFAPFTGGPFHYVDQVGAKTLVEQLTGLKAQYGSSRFTPCQLLQDYACDTQKRFFP